RNVALTISGALFRGASFLLLGQSPPGSFVGAKLAFTARRRRTSSISRFLVFFVLGELAQQCVTFLPGQGTWMRSAVREILIDDAERQRLNREAVPFQHA